MVYLYNKLTELLSEFDSVLEILRVPDSDLLVCMEHRNAFFELDGLIDRLLVADVLCVQTLDDMGFSNVDVIRRVDRMAVADKMLVICDVPATYELGVSQPLNRGVLQAMVQFGGNMLQGSSGVLFGRQKPGRPKTQYPDLWDKMYADWEAGALSSKEFLEWSCLKKATFYNMLGDYRELRRKNSQYLQSHGIA